SRHRWCSHLASYSLAWRVAVGDSTLPRALDARRQAIAQLLDDLLRRDGAVALIDPPLQQRDRHLVLRAECRRNPAGLAEAVGGRFGDVMFQLVFVAVDELGRQAQAGLVAAHEQEGFLADLHCALAPRMFFVRLGEDSANFRSAAAACFGVVASAILNF